MSDGLLLAVEALRAALPPERVHEARPEAIGAASSSTSGRERALAALLSLGDTLLMHVEHALHPLQFEVIFRQVMHALTVVRAWGPSSTSEEALDASLRCLRSLTSCTVAATPTASLLCAASLR